MKVKELISLFSSDTRYKILDANDPHYIIWWGQGNNLNTIVNEDEIKNIQHIKKGIVIYI